MTSAPAARQHLDAVLIYDVRSTREDSGNALGVLNLTIVGNWVAPSREVKGLAVANAMLLDVRNAYPYGNATARAEEESLWTNVGSGERAREMAQRAEVEAVRKLTAEVASMMARLKQQLEARPKPPAAPGG